MSRFGRNFSIRTGVRARLYEATRAVHDQLHQAAYVQRLLHQQASLLDYQIFLTNFAALFGAAVQALEQDCFPEEIICFSPRQQLACLQADLRYWKLSMGKPMHFNIKKTSQALGVAYVLHGAHFGISVLARSIHKLLAEFDAGGKNFIDCVVQQQNGQWKTLCEYLEQQLLEESEIANAIDGALQVFQQCQIHLGGYKNENHTHHGR